MATAKSKAHILKKEEKVPVREVRPEAFKVLLTWKAPVWPFKKKGREFFTTLGAVVFLLAIILAFLKEWLLIVVIIALSFVTYVMASVEPEEVEHKITNRGIVTGNTSYSWRELGRFWFAQKEGQKILLVESLAGLPRYLMFLLGKVKEEEVKRILSRYLLFEEPEKTWFERMSDWLAKRVPLERTDEH